MTGYDPSEGTVAKGLRTVAAALAYDDPRSGKTKIIMLNQAILIPHLDVHLLCPMQLRMNDVKLCEEPKFLADNPDDSTHALSIPPSEGSGEGLHIPLSLHGVASYFPVRRPTTEEWEECEQYEATYECPDWDPHSTTFDEQEESMTDSQGLMYDCDALGSRGQRHMIAGVKSHSDPSPSAEECFATALDNNHQVCMLGVQKSQVHQIGRAHV